MHISRIFEKNHNDYDHKHVSLKKFIRPIQVDLIIIVKKTLAYFGFMSKLKREFHSEQMSDMNQAYMKG